MRRRCGRLLVSIAAASFLVAGAVPADAGEAPSEEFCSAFADFYAVQFLVALAETFAEFDEDDGGGGGDDENIAAELYLVFSPKLEVNTETMLESAPASLEKALEGQLKVWRKGVKLLKRDVGLSDEAIEAIAALDPEASSGDAEDVLGDEIDDKKLTAAAKKFAKSVESLEEDATRKEERALAATATNCGVVPADVDCETLVTDDEATALLGDVTDTDTGMGCAWRGPEADGIENGLAVAVFASANAYERVTGELSGPGEPVPSLGDQAAVFEGFSSQTRGSTCGRTLVAVVDERTLQLSLCLGDTPVTTEQLTALAQQVSGRL